MGGSLSRRLRSQKGADQGLSPARSAASQALKRVQEEGAYASEAIEALINATDIPASDKAFAATLVRGVVRTQGVLDQMLDGYLEKPNRVRPDVRRALQIAAYELLFLGKEAFSAVDQGVRLTAKSAPYARRLANAVLRKVAVSAQAFPTGCPEEEFDSFCQGCGFPLGLGELLLGDLGELQARSLIAASCTQPPLFLHASSLRGDPHKLLESLSEAGIGFDVMEDIPLCIKLHQAKDVTHPMVRAAIHEGRLIVSDLAVQTVAYECVRFGLPASLLEVGAGRGTKTVLIQSLAKALYGTQIPRHVCVDAVPSKRAKLLERAKLCEANVTECLTADGAHLEQALAMEPFGVVLVDAPCSGLGTLRRHPEIVWRVGEEDILSLAALQERILMSVGGFAAPGGRLIYSTCTVTRQENEGVISSFLASPEGGHFTLQGGFQTLSTESGPDSHFCTVLRAEASSDG